MPRKQKTLRRTPNGKKYGLNEGFVTLKKKMKFFEERHMSCFCKRIARCYWCDITLACHCGYKTKTHRLEPNEEPKWADPYDLEFPWSCESCYELRKNDYNIIETFETKDT